jgi:hypothetical protein
VPTQSVSGQSISSVREKIWRFYVTLKIAFATYLIIFFSASKDNQINGFNQLFSSSFLLFPLPTFSSSPLLIFSRQSLTALILWWDDHGYSILPRKRSFQLFVKF